MTAGTLYKSAQDIGQLPDFICYQIISLNICSVAGFHINSVKMLTTFYTQKPMNQSWEYDKF